MGNEITDVMGIVNGTTNFILTKMTDEGSGVFRCPGGGTGAWLCRAPDPTADVKRPTRAARWRSWLPLRFIPGVTFADVYTEGISRISAKDIKYARELGCDIKLLGVARNTEDGIEVRVHPMLIPSSHPLASVKDAYNAVFVHGDAVDDTMFYGRGAGEMPTASAVVGDVIDVLRNMVWGCTGRIGSSCYRELPIKSMGEIESKYFMRLHAQDKPGVLATIAAVFGNNGVSIAQLIQKNTQDGFAEIAVMTESGKGVRHQRRHGCVKRYVHDPEDFQCDPGTVRTNYEEKTVSSDTSPRIRGARYEGHIRRAVLFFYFIGTSYPMKKRSAGIALRRRRRLRVQVIMSYKVQFSQNTKNDEIKTLDGKNEV